MLPRCSPAFMEKIPNWFWELAGTRNNRGFTLKLCGDKFLDKSEALGAPLRLVKWACPFRNAGWSKPHALGKVNIVIHLP